MLVILAASPVLMGPVAAKESAVEMPPRNAVLAALKKAGAFFREKCGRHGGYVWRYSRDFKLSEGEDETTESMIWVQPPGTPAVGAAFLDAFAATGDAFYLDAAKEAAIALVAGQLQSGGWYYSVEFDPARRRRFAYRNNFEYRPPVTGRDTHNMTMLDDDVTPSALRLLLRVNEVPDGKDARITDAMNFGLEAVMAAQAPNGGWRHNWDRYPEPMSEHDFPSVHASYPESWPREWPNDWRGVHYLNDNIAGHTLATLLLAAELTGDQKCLAAARKTGDFLGQAQMPPPQPAWAQQYDARMKPVWDRKFEPPAIAGRESEWAIGSLLLLYEKTGDEKFLVPIPSALDYLKKSRLPDGRLARFYELQTNRPLFFKITGKSYDLVYSADELPTHYAFITESHLDDLEAEYQRLRREGPKAKSPAPPPKKLAAQVRTIISSMDKRGAWIDARSLKGHKKASPAGVIQSETFCRNLSLLCQYLRAHRP
ncbi:MAG: polysaccharide lyase [Verrucomicrobiales bacterium]